MPTNLHSILIWTEAGQRYGLALETVQKVVRIVAITPLPGAPPGVLGLINVAGRVCPVLSLQHCFYPGAPRFPGFNEQLILARSARRSLALLAQEIQGLVSVPEEEVVSPAQVSAQLPNLLGVLKHPEGLVLLPDLELLASGPAGTSEPLLAHHGGAHGA